MSGWLIVDKPAGLTSATIVNKARWLLDAKKAGHAGTLDPSATGLLVVAFGEATKVLPYVTDALKEYEFTIRWGAATTTDDADGEVTATAPARPDRAAIESALPAFRGDILQVPPAFSAVKVDGERAYALARDGETPELAARPLHVAELELLDCPDADTARLRMICGKGGYVRAIARDLGQVLGCLGHVLTLRRTWSGPFTLARGPVLRWSDDLTREDLEPMLLALEAGLADLPQCRCDPAAAGRLANGNDAAVLSTDADNGEEAWASVAGRPVALGVYKFGMFSPSRVFNLGA
nr:tRNA pseudouridine(55) synthase TruB [Halovulum dunhuangense]